MWRKGNIPPQWEMGFHNFQYVKQPHTPEEDAMWKAAGYNHESYTGSMYGYPNKMPEYVYGISQKLGLTFCGYNFYRMDHMDIMPPHTDHYNTYVKKFNIEPSEVLRALVFLEDSKPGHYFIIGNREYTFWKAGDYFIWDQSEEHAAGNLGLHPRYTLQITGISAEKFSEEEYRQGIFWSNFSDHYDNLGFIGKYLDQNFRQLKELSTPYVVYTGVGEFQLPFEPTENFTIYLFEPLTFYIEGEKLNMGFYHEPVLADYDKIKSYELDSLLHYDVNIIVKTCDYNVSKYFTEKYPTLNLLCEDSFIRYVSPHPHTIPGKTILRNKKFFCPNWRYTYHRHLIMNYLADKDGNFSWYFIVEPDLDKKVWVDYNTIPNKIRTQVENGERLLRQTHFFLDKKHAPVEHFNEKTAWPSGHYGITAEYIEKMRECFVAVVNETRFSQQTGNFSEKTLDAIKAECAFVLAAPPYTLEYVMKLGFKTFSEFWDESYDLEEDPMKRMVKILETLEYINGLDLPTLYSEMKPIIQHNLQNCFELKNNINSL